MATVTLELTPDIRLMDARDLFNSTLNPLVYSKAVAGLTAYTGTIKPIKTPDTLAFLIDGQKLRVPDVDLPRFKRGGKSRPWLARFVDGSGSYTIEGFTLISSF